jgi:hypothetical protein
LTTPVSYPNNKPPKVEKCSAPSLQIGVIWDASIQNVRFGWMHPIFTLFDNYP